MADEETVEAVDSGSTDTDTGVAADAPAEESKPLDRSWSALQAAERRLRERSDAIKAQAKTLDLVRHVQELSAKDPVQAARAIGIDPYAIGSAILGEQKQERSEGEIHGERIGALERSIEELRAANARLLADREASEWSESLRGHVDSDPDRYGVVAAMMKSDPGYAARIREIIQRESSDSGVDADIGSVLAREEESRTAALLSAVEVLLTIPSTRARIATMVSGASSESREADGEKRPAKQAPRPKTLHRGISQEPTRSRPASLDIAVRRERAHEILRSARASKSK